VSLRTAALIGAVLLLIGVAPLLSALTAGLIAEAAGCDLHEGFVTPCVIAGADRGETLYAMFAMGWLGLVSLPLALIGAAALAVTAFLALLRRARR